MARNLRTVESIPFISSISSLAQRYDVLFCDVWGVVHDGVNVFPAARDAVTRFRKAGGTVILVSNASRPNGCVGPELERLGIGSECYDALITSGDVARTFLSRQPGIKIFDVGPGSARTLCQDLDVQFTGLYQAEIAITSGAFQADACSPDHVHPTLRELSIRRLWLVCANPDVETQIGAKRVKCSGAVAELYREMAGPVFYTGKPDREIFKAALARAEQIRKTSVLPGRILVIGDSLRTDIAGAHTNGFDSLFVMGGIHSHQLGELDSGRSTALNRLFVQSGCTPSAIAWRLAW